MTSLLPELITCVVTTDGCPVKGLALICEHKVLYKNPYSQFFGPTYIGGHTELTREEIIKSAHEEVRTQQMGYGSIERDYAGVTVVWLPSIKELEGALEAYGTWSGAVEFGEGYEEMLRHALAVMKNSRGTQFFLDASVIPESVKLVVHQPGPSRELPELIECTVTCNGNPVRGVCIACLHRSYGKDDFHDIAGPTDKEGRVRLTREHIENRAEYEIAVPEECWRSIDRDYVGVTEVWIPTADEISNGLEQCRNKWTIAKYPKGHEKSLKRTLSILRDGRRTLRISDVRVTPPDIQLIIRESPPDGQET